ncbi:hypothetical protein LXL04_008516 [Taraxacum kok-saghyz]
MSDSHSKLAKPRHSCRLSRFWQIRTPFSGGVYEGAYGGPHHYDFILAAFGSRSLVYRYEVTVSNERSRVQVSLGDIDEKRGKSGARKNEACDIDLYPKSSRYLAVASLTGWRGLHLIWHIAVGKESKELLSELAGNSTKHRFGERSLAKASSRGVISETWREGWRGDGEATPPALHVFRRKSIELLKSNAKLRIALETTQINLSKNWCTIHAYFHVQLCHFTYAFLPIQTHRWPTNYLIHIPVLSATNTITGKCPLLLTTTTSTAAGQP